MPHSIKGDVVVIGGGPAGMAAALSSWEAGARSVFLLERNEYLGGILPQCIHPGFGLQIWGEELTGPEYAETFIEKLNRTGVEVMTDTTVLELSPERVVKAVNSEGVWELKADSIILSMGCRERTRGMLRIPGHRPAGIFTAGLAQYLVNIAGYLPGEEIVILGSGDIGLIMARRLTLEGARVKMVVEIKNSLSGLVRNYVQCIQDFNIPLLFSHTVTEVRGKERVEAVMISEVDEGGNPLSGSEREVECDTLLLSVGLIPENELSRQAKIPLSPLTGGPWVDEDFSTDLEGFFACGNVVSVFESRGLCYFGGRKSRSGSSFSVLSSKKIYFTNRRRGAYSYSPANKGRERRFFIYSAAKEHEKCNGISSMGRKDILRKEDIDLPAQ